MLSNRAACHLKTGDLPAAVRDCTASLELVPHSVKPLCRRANAYEHLERWGNNEVILLCTVINICFRTLKIIFSVKNRGVRKQEVSEKHVFVHLKNNYFDEK